MIVPAVVSFLTLGLAFDMFEVLPTSSRIYDEADIKSKLQVETNEVLESKFRVINNSSELLDFLNIGPELALKEKYRSIGLSLYKEILKYDVDRSKTVEILFYVNYEVGSSTFSPDTKLRTDWQTRPQKYVGTHYIKSIRTGGQFLASYKLNAAKPEYMDDIRAAVASYIGVSGNIDESLTRNLGKFQDAIKGKAFPDVTTSTVGAFYNRILTNLHSIIEAAIQLPKMVKNRKDGRGEPLKLELVDLHTVEPSYSEYKRNSDLIPVLREVFEKYDDLRVSMKEYKNWSNRRPYIPREQRKRDDDYYGRLYQANKAMTSALARLDMSGSTNQFDQAFKAYGEGGGSNKYLTELHALMKSFSG